MVSLTVVADGLEALAAVQGAPYDIVLMDMQMPRMDGLEATAAIRRFERESGRPRTPLIMVSANTRPEHVKAGLDAGADAYLCKPVTSDRLFSAMASVLQPPLVALIVDPLTERQRPPSQITRKASSNGSRGGRAKTSNLSV